MKRSRWLAAVAGFAITATSHGQLVELWRTFPNTDQYPRPRLRTGSVDVEGNVTLGGSVSGASWMLVVRFDAQGNQQWYRAFNFGTSEALESSALLNNGTIAFGGLYYTTGMVRSAALVFTRQGDIVAHYNEPGHESAGSIAGVHGDKIVLFGVLNGQARTTLFSPQLARIWAHTYAAPEPVYSARSGVVASDLIARNPEYANARNFVFPRLVCLDSTGVLLSAVSFDFGYLETRTSTNHLTGYGNGKVALGTFTHEPLGNWQNVLYGVDARTGIDWDHWFPPNGSFQSTGFRLWTDPLGRLLAYWFDGGGDQYLFHIDAQSGNPIRSVPFPLPRIRQTEEFNLFATDDAGAHYFYGWAYDHDGGFIYNVREMVLKIDRHLRSVWLTFLEQPPMGASWMAHHRGSLYIMMTNVTTPPLVKYKILAVRSEGDVSGDGCIDDKDLAMVLEAFGTANPWGDLNGDGIVDDLDLEEVLHNFGLGCG